MEKLKFFRRKLSFNPYIPKTWKKKKEEQAPAEQVNTDLIERKRINEEVRFNQITKERLIMGFLYGHPEILRNFYDESF